MGLILPIWGLILPRIPPPTPVLYSTVTNLYRGCVRTQNTPNPAPKHPVSRPPPPPPLNLKLGKMNYSLGKMRPQLGNMFEKWTKIF